MIPINLTDASQNKYNQWGKQIPLVCDDSQLIEEANALLVNASLPNLVKQILYVNKLTNCKGFEFIAFSNAKFDTPVKLPGEIILYPCFATGDSGIQLDKAHGQANLQMIKTSNFIYDGWLPIEEFSEQNILSKLRNLRESFAYYSILSGSSFDWISKYRILASPNETHFVGSDIHTKIDELSEKIATIPNNDREALFRSIGWLSESLKQDKPESKFLFAILAIESLCNYIEKDCEDNSIFRNLKSQKISKSERRKVRNCCINDIINDLYDTNPTVAITKSYFNCVTGIKKQLIDHMKAVLGENHTGIDLFFSNTNDDKAIYDLRHTIAHGTHDTLNMVDITTIERKVHLVVDVASDYLWNILHKTLAFYNSSEKQRAAVFMDPTSMILSNVNMYNGPIDISVIYAKKTIN